MDKQEKISFTSENKILSLNDNLYDDLFIEELEARLETDPFAVGGLIDLLYQTEEITSTDVCFSKSDSCTEHSCSTQCGIKLEICKCVFDFF